MKEKAGKRNGLARCSQARSVALGASHWASQLTPTTGPTWVAHPMCRPTASGGWKRMSAWRWSDRDLGLTEPLLGGLVVRLLRGFVVSSRQAVVLPEANSLILRALQQLAAPAPCPNLSAPSLLVDPPPQLLSRGGLEREGHLRRGDAGAP